MKLLFLIATCERPKMLGNLVSQIRSLTPLPFKIIIVNDASQSQYPQMNVPEVSYHRLRDHRGKKRYWEVVDMLFQAAHDEEFSYAFKLDDDIELAPGAIEQTLSILKILGGPGKKNVVNMWVDHRADQKVWVNINPHPVRFESRKLRRVGWIDAGNWAASRAVMEALGWRCPEPDPSWWDKAGDSSGVGKYLSLALSRAACRIYMPYNGLIYHGGHDSVMHKDKTDRPIEMSKRPWAK